MNNNRVSQMRYNAQELMNMANYLRRNTDSGFVSNVNRALSNIATAWQGPAADAFTEKVRTLVNRMQDCKTQQYNLMANRLGTTAMDLERATASIINGINRF